MSLCPACNGLVSITELCLHCGNIAIDMGAREDFYGPYRPYMSDTNDEYTCTHLLYCTECYSSISWPVPMIDGVR